MGEPASGPSAARVRLQNTFAGVDGCSSGWICASAVDTGAPALAVFTRFDLLLAALPDAAVAIDIPIGLPAAGARVCDLEARARLGARRASVFPAPIRPCLAARTHAAASALRRQIEGKGVSAQAWGIFAKVREVDDVMTPSLQTRVVETHPELVFADLNGGRPLQFSKKTVAGRLERIRLLYAAIPEAMVLAGGRPPRGAEPDDVLDAVVALYAARRFAIASARRVPAQPPTDERGLRMEVWY